MSNQIRKLDLHPDGTSLGPLRINNNENYKKINLNFELADNFLNNVQTQVDTLVVNGDSSPAADQARVDESGFVHPSLRARLNSSDASLAQTTTKSKNVIEIYVSVNEGSDETGSGTESNPFKNPQKAIENLPEDILHDVVIHVKNGVYTDVGGISEWGRTFFISFFQKRINPKRRSDKPVNTKHGKVTIQGESKDGVIFDGSTHGIRTGVLAHQIQGIMLRDITVKGCHNGISAHQGGDISGHNLKLIENNIGAKAESNARLEIGWSDISNNTEFGFWLKNGQLQLNNSTLNDNQLMLETEGAPYVWIRDCTGTMEGRDTFNLKGCSFLEIRACNFKNGRHFLNGSFNYCRISIDTHVSNFSNVFNYNMGYVIAQESHFWDNNFVVFSPNQGNGNIYFLNCDSKNESGVEVPNKQATPIRFYNQGTATFQGSSIKPEAVFHQPNGGLVLRGSAPPTSGYHERGKIMLNSGASFGRIKGWICTLAGTPGTWEVLDRGYDRITNVPDYIGQIAVAGGVGYISTGTSSTADWKQITS